MLIRIESTDLNVALTLRHKQAFVRLLPWHSIVSSPDGPSAWHHAPLHLIAGVTLLYHYSPLKRDVLWEIRLKSLKFKGFFLFKKWFCSVLYCLLFQGGRKIKKQKSSLCLTLCLKGVPSAFSDDQVHPPTCYLPK